MKKLALFTALAVAALGTNFAYAGSPASHNKHAHSHAVKAQQTKRVQLQSVTGPHHDGMLLQARKDSKPKMEPAMGADFSKVRAFGGKT